MSLCQVAISWIWLGCCLVWRTSENPFNTKFAECFLPRRWVNKGKKREKGPGRVGESEARQNRARWGSL